MRRISSAARVCALALVCALDVSAAVAQGSGAASEHVIGFGTPTSSAPDDFAYYGASSEWFATEHVLRGDEAAAAELGASWTVLYDFDNLYFLIRVRDPDRNVNAQYPWEGDSVEIFVDPDASGGTAYDGVNDYQLIVTPNHQIAVGVNSIQTTEGVAEVTGYPYRGSLSYVMAVKLPWATLGIDPEPGMELGLDVHVNDGDVTMQRKSTRATFANVDDSWTNPSSFGRFLLGPEAAPPLRIPGVDFYDAGLPWLRGHYAWQFVPRNAVEKTLLGAEPTHEELSGSWQVMWDGDALYLLAYVNDATLVSDSEWPWEDDSLELYLDLDAGAATYGPHQAQLVFRVGDDQVHVGSATSIDPTGIEFVLEPTSSGYLLEAVIPWSLFDVSPALGMKLGIDVHLNGDRDGQARDTKLATFADQDIAWQDPRVLGRAALGQPARYR